MPLQKIVSWDGKKWFQCLHSGILSSKCYAMPDRDRFGRRKNGGSFADAACAVAWLENQFLRGKVTDKKHKALLSAIKEELIPNLPGIDLIAAPDMDPDHPDFSYRDSHPWVFAEDLLLDIGTVLSWKENDKEKEKEEASLSKPFIYQARKGELYLLDHAQFPMPMNVLIDVMPEMEMVILEDMDCPADEGVNELVEEAFGIKLERPALFILSKKIKEEKKKKDVKRKRAKKSSSLTCLGGGRDS